MRLGLFLLLISAAVAVRAETVLVLGDSLSAAYNIPLEDGWVRLLERRLAAGGCQVEVVNASISGETSLGGLNRLPKLLKDHQPSVVIVELGGNDGLRGFPPDSLYQNLDAIVSRAQAAGARVVLTGIRVPTNYGPRYGEQFAAVFERVAAEREVPLIPFLLDGVALDPEMIQSDGVHPTAAAQPRILANVLPALAGQLDGCEPAPAAGASTPVAIAVHGGAGTIVKSELRAEEEDAIRSTLERAVRAGHGVLAAGGTSLDAVQAAVLVLEDSPLFNAGKGAVFNHEGINELDAAIMDGATLDAGAVAGLNRVRNPILAARKVMEASPHVLLFGEGAEAFAAEQGLTLVEPQYFHTEKRWQQLQEAIAKQRDFDLTRKAGVDRFFSTVGAVALDRNGNLAAATSTGGLTNKRYGRVGDVPVIGAGTYADNHSCAVSATGHGEYFIRSVVAHDICAQVAYRDLSLVQAADAVVMGKLVERGGRGGVIAIDREGNIAMPFNTEGMYRAAIGTDGALKVGIYADNGSISQSE